MARESLGDCQSFKAAADYSTKQHYLMYLSAADTITICGAAGKVIGILQTKPAANEYGQVLTKSGVLAKAIAATGVSVGDYLESDSSGRVTAYTYDADGTTETYQVGIANEASTANNQIITILTQFCPSSK